MWLTMLFCNRLYPKFRDGSGYLGSLGLADLRLGSPGQRAGRSAWAGRWGVPRREEHARTVSRNYTGGAEPRRGDDT